MALFKKQEIAQTAPPVVNDPPPEQTPVYDIAAIDPATEEVESETPTSALPEYLLTDPEVVGFTDTESQYNFYAWALTGIDVVEKTVLDQGCGRGDFYNIIAARGGTYTGVEFNPVLCKAAEELGHKSIYNEDWFNIDAEFDWVFNIFGMLQPYGAQGDDSLELLNRTIEHTLPNVKEGMVLMLIADNSGVESYNQHKIADVVGLLPDHRYIIDRSINSSIFKITIYK